jgi:hypothetical protein
MTPQELLSLLRDLGAVLTARGDRLHVKAPPGVLTPDLKDAIAMHKCDLLRMITPVATESTWQPLVTFAQLESLYSQYSHNSQNPLPRWTPRVGPARQPTMNVVRLMPKHPNMTDLFAARLVHYGLGDVGRAAVLCAGLPRCRVCQWQDRLRAEAARHAEAGRIESMPAIWDRLRPTNPVTRYGTNLVDWGRPQDLVQVFWCSRDVRTRITTLARTRDLTDPDSGHAVRLWVSRHPKRRFPVYERIEVDGQSSPLFDKPRWLPMVQDLLNLEPPPVAAIEAVLRETPVILSPGRGGVRGDGSALRPPPRGRDAADVRPGWSVRPVLASDRVRRQRDGRTASERRDRADRTRRRHPADDQPTRKGRRR